MYQHHASMPLAVDFLHNIAQRKVLKHHDPLAPRGSGLAHTSDRLDDASVIGNVLAGPQIDIAAWMPQVRRSGSAAHTHALRIQAAYFNIAIGPIETPAPGRDFAGPLTSARQSGPPPTHFATQQLETK